MHMLNGFVPNSISASGTTSWKNFSKIQPWTCRTSAKEKRQQAPWLSPTPGTAYKPARSQTKHLHFPKGLRKKSNFSCKSANNLKHQFQKGAGEHTWICQVDCLKCGISSETMSDELAHRNTGKGIKSSCFGNLSTEKPAYALDTHCATDQHSEVSQNQGLSALVSQKPSAIYRVCVAKHGPRPKTFISLHILLLQDTALLKALAKTHTGREKNGWTGQMVGL